MRTAAEQGKVEAGRAGCEQQTALGRMDGRMHSEWWTDMGSDE